MKLEDLRQRRQVRRAKRQSGQNPWGTASLIVGAATAVTIYVVARSCADPAAPPPSVLIDVSPTEIRVNGKTAVLLRDGGSQLDQQFLSKTEESLRTYLTRQTTSAPSVPASPVLVRGAPGVSFALLQCVARSVEGAGFGTPRLVNPRADHREE